MQRPPPEPEEALLDVHTACWAGNLDALLQQLLLQGGAGAAAGDAAVAAAVRAAAARDATRLGGGNTPLHYAAYNARSLACLDLLLRLRVPLDARNDAGCTPLFFAAQNGNAEAVATLMRRGADPALCESETGCSFSPAEVGADDARVLAALECGALRSRGVLYARPSRLRAPVLLAPSELVFAENADGGARTAAAAAEAVAVRLRPRQPLRVQLDVSWAASVSRISGREAARTLGEVTARLAAGGLRPPAPPRPAGLDDSIARPPPPREGTGEDDDDDNDEFAGDGSDAGGSGGAASATPDTGGDLRSAGDAMFDADTEYALRLPSVALVPMPWASVEVGVIDVTAPAEPVVARRVLLGRKACEAAACVCVVEGLATGRTFMVKVRAVNALGRGPWSAPTLPITVGRGAGADSGAGLDARAPGALAARSGRVAPAEPFSSESSSARLGEAWAEEAAAVGEREVLRSSTARPTSVRLEELGASLLPEADFAAMTSRRALLSVRTGGSGRSASKVLSREQQAAAEAAEAAALAAAIAAAQAAARAATMPRSIGRGVMAAPARAPGAKPAAPPKPPRAKLIPVIYKVAPDVRGDEDEDEDGEGPEAEAAADGTQQPASTASSAAGAQSAAAAPSRPAAAKARARSPSSSAAARPKARKKAAAAKATTLGGVRQPRRYFAPAYYADPYMRQMGDSMLRDEAAERERLIEAARAEGDAEALAAAEAEAAAAAAAVLEAEADDDEDEVAAAAEERPRPSADDEDEEDRALRGSADRTVRFADDSGTAAAAAAEAQPAPKRTSKVHDSSLRSFLASSAEESRARREGLGLRLDLGALAERLPGVLREAGYDPAHSPALSREFAEDSALGLSLRSSGPAPGLGARAERQALSARLAGDDAEAVAARKRDALAQQLGAASGSSGGGPRPPPVARAATRGAAPSLFVTPAPSSPYASYSAPGKGPPPPRVADMLIAHQRRNAAGAPAFAAGAGKSTSLLGPSLSANEVLYGGVRKR